MHDDTATHHIPTQDDTVTMSPAHVLPPAHLPAHLPAEVPAHLPAELQGELQGGMRFATLSAAAATALLMNPPPSTRAWPSPAS